MSNAPDNGPDYSPELRAAVEAMKKGNGVYFIQDYLDSSKGAVVCVVHEGKIFATKVDQELNPERFSLTAVISGPFVPSNFQK